jgi:putative DNA primase/helicase
MANFPCTDAGNAEMFAWASQDDLRYDYKRGRWLLWRGQWWSEDLDELVMRRAKSVARMRAQATQGLPKEEKKEELRWAFKSESRAHLEAMLKLARSEYPLYDSGEGWDVDPMLLGVPNGVVDLRTGTLREGRQSDKITLHSGISFDPSAQCPRWEQFVCEIFGGDPQIMDFVKHAVGYCLTGDTQEQCLFLCHGHGANGKSTFLEVLRHVFGSYAHNLPFSAFELRARSSISNDIAAIAGKRLITAIETNESAQLNEARIKMLTGCDAITARLLYREYVTFSPTGKLWLAFNHLPEVTDDSTGFWRRIRLIPFLQHFEGDTADKDLLSKLLSEASGILTWAVQGCLAWQRDKLSIPPTVREATETYRHESYPLDDFIAELYFRDPGASVVAGVIWADYCEWINEHQDTLPLDRKAFSRRLIAMGFKKVRQGRGRVWTWLGIGRKSDNP